ncbi:hypothetical protein PPERSA_05939 [Pseudocohnilembus persalinus]|uniref:MORN motif n=1 Tax=Pseudocohnilembus persalinus TaxID=266149 RepID=A0A0V0R462_PSEPJ|nr:hypothetical protein PPERSA_05939 [Pseudocohnilembus persalinus]|eukprot:KRX09270.1 hypothetical protein PPERSA_05939 [Pseudocohnilembus persalinus]
MQETSPFKISQRSPELCLPIELTRLIYQTHSGKTKDQNHEQKVYDQTLQGPCQIKFKNGNLYEGEVNQGYLEGTGLLRCFNGTLFKGDFFQNEIRGQGCYEWPDGSSYQGQVSQGLRHGQGKYVAPGQEVSYEGAWEKGLRHGKGTMKFKNGQIYEGEFFKGLKQGNGKMTYPNQNFYQGEWYMDKKDGYGVMHWTSLNQKYEGEWKNNLQNGFGVHVWMDGKGEIKEIRNRYEGQWVNGIRQGYGTFYYASGAKYEGEWNNNQKNGVGILTDEFGEVKQGEFKNDKLNIQRSPEEVKKLMKKKLKVKQVQQAFNDAGSKKKNQGVLKKPNSAFKSNKKNKNVKIDDSDKKKDNSEYEIQINPYHNQIDIQDLLNLYPEQKLNIHTKLIQVLLRNNSELKYLYNTFQQKYDSSIGENQFCMNLKNFWQFCRESKILSPNVTLAQINRLFAQGAKNKFELDQNNHDIKKKIEITKDLQKNKKQISSKEMANIDIVEMLQKIKQENVPSLFKMKEQDYKNFCKNSDENTEKTKFSMENSLQGSKFNSSKNKNRYPSKFSSLQQKKLKDLHNGQIPIMFRHFVDLLIRVTALKYQDMPNLNVNFENLVFQKILPTLEKQAAKASQSQNQISQQNMSNTSNSYSHLRVSTLSQISMIEDNEYNTRFKKSLIDFNDTFLEIFSCIMTKNKNEKFGIQDRTVRVIVMYKMLINCGYIQDMTDKHIIFHLIEKSFDPTQVISVLDVKFKKINQVHQQQEKNGIKKGKNYIIRIKKKIDNLKQLKLIQMLQSELIYFEFQELLLSFLCRKDKDMGHTKNEENFKKKLQTHLTKILNFAQKNHKICQIQEQNKKKLQPQKIWPSTHKDELKEELLKKRDIRNKIEEQQRKEKEQILREAKERLAMEKEDFNVPDNNQEDFSDYAESEIEVYDNDYLANF